MRFSLSQGFNFGPFKFTVSRSGLSCSVGNSLGRVGVNSKGRANVRLGASGLSWRRSKSLGSLLSSMMKK